MGTDARQRLLWLLSPDPDQVRSVTSPEPTECAGGIVYACLRATASTHKTATSKGGERTAGAAPTRARDGPGARVGYRVRQPESRASLQASDLRRYATQPGKTAHGWATVRRSRSRAGCRRQSHAAIALLAAVMKLPSKLAPPPCVCVLQLTLENEISISCNVRTVVLSYHQKAGSNT